MVEKKNIYWIFCLILTKIKKNRCPKILILIVYSAKISLDNK